MTDAGHYVDAAAFTALFRHRRKNHQQICQILELIASGIARRFWFASQHDRADAQANALLAAIERIDRFKVSRGRDAFAYYSSVLTNSILRQLSRNKRHAARVTLFTDVDTKADEFEGVAGCAFDITYRGTPYTRCA